MSMTLLLDPYYDSGFEPSTDLAAFTKDGFSCSNPERDAAKPQA
jgi:hypothetical protein